MRTKKRSTRPPFSKSSRGSFSSTTTRRLPSPIPDSNAEDSTDLMELEQTSEGDGDVQGDRRESNVCKEKQDGLNIMDLDLSEEKTCIKCNVGGELLLCCGIGCPIALHDKCIPFNPRYDEEGNFYCPFCWYKRQLDMAEELRKKALLAKKNLQEFMDFEPVEVDHAKEKHNDGKAKGNDSNVRPVVGERNQNEHLKRMEQGKNNQAGDEQDERIFEEEEQAESLKLNAHCVEEESVVDSALHKSAQVTSETTKASEGNQVREEEKEQIHQGGPETNVTYTGGDAALNVPEMCDSDTEIVAGRQNCGRRPSERGGDQAREGEKEQIHGDAPETNVTYTGAGVALNKPEMGYSDTVPMNNQSADVPKKSSFHPHTTSADEAMKQKEEVPAKISTNLPFSHEGRKRFPWKSEEEDKLKEGLQKFSTKNKNIPWRKILEFGRDVFHVSRSPADLKDKWRQIVARESLTTKVGHLDS
ncbi:uncharacterized protein LOC110655908 isoform X2 [Hevea brasiliensis]|uniref:uncharacterized protein LOC110655908 isoform X2 n=1 Tax=Hevea brasiliensis TaxID=3981 RepID=UPI0025DF82A7|nr:uncharacterized protein LOC110655908 isoform X2 [Hevea brasiliensis]